MDYKAIYYKIIEKAKKETENRNRHVGYYERHHIQPKSLGGTNDKENLVKLTAREHFICHWLLVKMFNKGTVERHKMLCALWRMQGQSTKEKCRYINSHAYEALRIEFSNYIGELNSKKQKGKNNSQYGTKWYTNRNTGESKKFKEKPDDTWIEGRNVFNGNELWSIVYKTKVKSSYHYPTINEFNYYKEHDLITKNGKLKNLKGISTDEWDRRKNLILNCGVDLTKFGWVKLVSIITGLNRTTINNIVLHFPELKEIVYYRK